jgi:hypothetical protein
MGYKEMVAWLTQADINQINDGLKMMKIKKIKVDGKDTDTTKTSIDH